MSASSTESDGSEKSTKRVTVVIPNWNGKDLLGPCLESLNRQTFQDFEVIVVDNGSTDESAALLQKYFPQVKLIRLEKNYGFSAAVNVGIAASYSPYIALLNNDTEVHSSWLKELLEALEANPKAGSAASKILFSHDRSLINTAGDEWSVFGVAYQRGNNCRDDPKYNRLCFVFSACACAALYRRDVLNRVGLFDESFFAYMEDVDLGFRIQLAGYLCLYVPSATVYHKHQQTSSRIPHLRDHWTERNKLLVLLKDMPCAAFLLTLPFTFLFTTLNFWRIIRRRQLLIYLKAISDVVGLLPRVLRERRAIQKNRTITGIALVRKMRLIGALRFVLFPRVFSRIQRTKKKREIGW